MQSLKPFTRKKALQLIKTIKDQGDQLTFDNTGSVFLEGNTLPNANFFRLISSLFSGKHDEPGFSEFVKKLQEMGLSKFIPKKSKVSNVSVEVNLNTLKPFNVDKWYYIGP